MVSHTRSLFLYLLPAHSLGPALIVYVSETRERLAKEKKEEKEFHRSSIHCLTGLIYGHVHAYGILAYGRS